MVHCQSRHSYIIINLNPHNMCNGTRLDVKAQYNTIKTIILKDKVYIFTLHSKEQNLPFTF